MKTVPLFALACFLCACFPQKQPAAPAPPASSLLRVDPLKAGKHCAVGGVSISSGVDQDRSGRLERSEVQSKGYLCSAGPSIKQERRARRANRKERLLERAVLAIKELDFDLGYQLCSKALVENPSDQRATMTCVIAACNLRESEQAHEHLAAIQSATRKAGLVQICSRLGVEGFHPEEG